MYWTGENPPHTRSSKCKPISVPVDAFHCSNSVSPPAVPSSPTSPYFENPPSHRIPLRPSSKELPERTAIHSKTRKRRQEVCKCCWNSPSRRGRGAQVDVHCWVSERRTGDNIELLHFHLPHLDSVRRPEEGKQRAAIPLPFRNPRTDRGETARASSGSIAATSLTRHTNRCRLCTADFYDGRFSNSSTFTKDWVHRPEHYARQWRLLRGVESPHRATEQQNV